MRTRPSLSSSSIASNDPVSIAIAWIAGSPHWRATASAKPSSLTVSFAA